MKKEEEIILEEQTIRNTQLEDVFQKTLEFNNNYLELLSEAGLNFVGKSSDGMLVEVVEISNHPWFVGCLFHPEFTSDPINAHPLFKGFIKAAKSNSK